MRALELKEGSVLLRLAMILSVSLSLFAVPVIPPKGTLPSIYSNPFLQSDDQHHPE